MTELIAGTKKGLFLLEGDPGAGVEINVRAFAGEPVDFATRDPRSKRLLATVTSPFYGPKIFYTDGDPGGEWEQSDGVALREGAIRRSSESGSSPVARPTERSTRGEVPGSCSRATTPERAGRSTPGYGSSPGACNGSQVVVGSACTRSGPGREIATGWRSPSRPPG